MEPFALSCGSRYVITTNIEDLGRPAPDERRPDQGDDEWERFQATKVLNPMRKGRPRDEAKECNMCSVLCQNHAILRQHFRRAHMFGEYAEKHRDSELNCRCPVPGCCMVWGKDPKPYNKHMEDEKVHTVKELLYAGVEAYKYNRKTR